MTENSVHDVPNTLDQSQEEGIMARQEAVDELRDDVKRLKEDLKAILESVSETGSAKWEHISGRMKDQAAAKYDQLKDAAEYARQRGSQATHAARETVASHPLSWVLGAMGLGIVLGKLMGRK